MTIQQKKSALSSVISQMLNKDNSLSAKPKPGEFTIKIANTLEERESVFNLGYKTYLAKGFINENPKKMLIQSYDFDSETVILMVQDQQNNIAGSVTLVFEDSSHLPAEKIYGEELNILRKQNEKIVEISRLIIDPQYRNSKEVLVLLFNYLYIYSYFIKHYSCLTIEVNPRHTAFYQALLHFRAIGEQKPCPNVQNAPAILMYVSIVNELERLSQLTQIEKNKHSLFRYFLKPEQEKLVAYYLEKQMKPMTMEEKLYFGYSESGVNRVVCK